MEKEMTEKQKTVLNNLIGYLNNKTDSTVAYGFSEPGYPINTIGLFANWNNVSDKLFNWIEEYFGDFVKPEWIDEWITCDICGKAVCTEPAYYGWQSSFVTVDHDIICVDCYEDNLDDIIDEYKNTTEKCLPSCFLNLLEKQGFVCYSPDKYCKRYETGFHPGQTDDPKNVAKEIEKELPEHDYIFILNDVGQFDIKWNVFIRKRKEE